MIDRYLDGELAPVWQEGPRRPGHGLLLEERRLLHVLASTAA